jgi:hypothetical protein
MKALTKEGKRAIETIAEKYQLKTESIETLARAVVNGNGSMAQFNIPELGGNGQWMRGGMTMVGDMFNNSLKAKVDNLCSELANLISTKVIFEESQDLPTDIRSNSSSTFWPSVFGHPTTSGSQNNFKYAYFAPSKRLVIEEDGLRKIYDTKHHHISGVSQQQQGVGRSYQFTSQDGAVDINSLPIVSESTNQSQETPEMPYDVTNSSGSKIETPATSPEDIIIATIGKVNLLFERGQITEEEFKAKKQELLAKL